MGIIYIGDRNVGKTHLVLELANTSSNYVKVTYPEYGYLKKLLYDEEEQKTAPTNFIIERSLEIQAQLPTGVQQLTLDWLDTPGEMWRSVWQQDNPQDWQSFLNRATQSEGILLILPPYRDIIQPDRANPGDFVTKQQWCNRFENWVNFFRYQCSKTRHLAICMNKADLFCQNLTQEASKLSYVPNRSQMNWQQRDVYVFDRYFRPIHEQIRQLNKYLNGLSVRCFLTSIHSRELLELPWIYLATYLAE